MTKKYKYVYDIKKRRFIKKLNEEENTDNVNNTESNNTTTTNNSETSNTNTETTTNKTVKSVESNEDIQLLNNKLTTLKQKYDTDIITLNKLLNAAKIAATNKDLVGSYDPVMTDSNVLSIMKKINDINRKYYTDICNIEDQRITLLTKMSLMRENYYKIPDKYKYLNESNIHTAKIYMGNLIGTDNNLILKGMVDFKRVFKDTNLLYGKDKDGYFIVALDSEDFNLATDALEEVGYLRDDILDTIMPQVLDRHTMIQ